MREVHGRAAKLMTGVSIILHMHIITFFFLPELVFANAFRSAFLDFLLSLNIGIWCIGEVLYVNDDNS